MKILPTWGDGKTIEGLQHSAFYQSFTNIIPELATNGKIWLSSKSGASILFCAIQANKI